MSLPHPALTGPWDDGYGPWPTEPDVQGLTSAHGTEPEPPHPPDEPPMEHFPIPAPPLPPDPAEQHRAEPEAPAAPRPRPPRRRPPASGERRPAK
jgi:hypothetical protein